MSNSHEKTPTQPTLSNYTLSLIGAVLSLLLFVFIVFIAYLPNRPAPVDQELVQTRATRLAELNAAQAELADSYKWVNKPEGVVRIPIERAMELTVQRLQSTSEESDG